MDPSTENRFLEELVKRRYIDSLQLGTAFRERGRVKDATGKELLLGQILLRDGAISTEQFLGVSKAIGNLILQCRSCATLFSIAVAENTERICSCGRTLEEISEESGNSLKQTLAGSSFSAVETAKLPAVALPPSGELSSSGAPARQVVPAVAAPQSYQFGRYTLLEELGRGASGVVFKASHPELGIPVALKILTEDLNRNSEAVARFLREGRLMTELDHENIVKVYEYGAVDERSYLVMDFIDGRSLDWHLQYGMMEQGRALTIIEALCEGGHHAHEKGIVHRDLKPANILLSADGRPLITDFGLAKAEDLSLTQSGMAVGTPYYMSPEQIQSDRSVDRRADVYSLGVLSYRMLAGELPFRAASSYELYQRVLNRKPKAPSKLNAALAAEFDLVILKAMQKDRGRRYQTLEEMARDIRCLGQGKKPIHARRRWPRRPRLRKRRFGK